MVAGGVESEDLAIEHVREPGEGVPVASMKRGEGPTETVESESTPDKRVFRDVVRVVVV